MGSFKALPRDTFIVIARFLNAKEKLALFHTSNRTRVSSIMYEIIKARRERGHRSMSFLIIPSTLLSLVPNAPFLDAKARSRINHGPGGSRYSMQIRGPVSDQEFEELLHGADGMQMQIDIDKKLSAGKFDALFAKCMLCYQRRLTITVFAHAEPWECASIAFEYRGGEALLLQGARHIMQQAILRHDATKTLVSITDMIPGGRTMVLEGRKVLWQP